jgi:formylglycine-generating enzyme required for sulfatase activity
VFPWGDEPDPNRANCGYSNIGNTSAVGCFAPNDYGLYDIVGNVWEWTRSLQDFDYPYVANDPQREDLQATGNRVVRGGAWSLHRGKVRCAIRSDYLPDIHRNSIGFRLILRSPRSY